MLAAVGHRQPAHEVGHPRVAGPLLARVLVQVVVELPRLVADPQVVAVLAHDVVEDHEVVDRGSRPSAGWPGSSAGRARRTPTRCGRDSFARCALAGWIRSPSASSTRVTGSWASQSISRPSTSVAQLAGDRHVALGVAEADRRRDVEGALAPVGAVDGRVAPRARRPTNSRRARFTWTGLRACGRWPAPSTVSSRPPVISRERLAVRVGGDAVLGPVNDEDRAADALRRARSGRAASPARPARP